MKGVFSAESIGWGVGDRMTYRMSGVMPSRGDRKPWMAEITGLSARYGYQRRFLDRQIDYTKASSSGARGVYYWWTLEHGVMYEASYPVSWSRAERCFLTVDGGGDVVKVTEEEVRAWLEDRLNVGSVSTS